jgi:hypothetical protein
MVLSSKNVNKVKVCVIGAGPSGLVTIKELRQRNVDVECYESQNGIGGAFRSVGDGGRSYDSIELTISNFFMAFSDFMPTVNEKRRYWKVQEYREYLHAYAKKFNLYEHIYLSHKVTQAGIKDNKAQITVVHNGKEFVKSFDHLIICSGSHFVPSLPEFTKKSTFKGQILHSCQYTNAEQYEGKKVLCIGLGESGADIVHEISQVTSCHVLVRNIPNVIPRWINNFTNDAYTAYCYYEMGKKGIDFFMKFKAWVYLKVFKGLNKEEIVLQEWIHERNSFTSKFFTKNDVFIKDLISEKLLLSKGVVSQIEQDGVITDANKKIEADIILCNTGYLTNFENFSFGKDFTNSRNLFKQMIHPKYGTLISKIGWARPTQGGSPACAEMQARYITLLITGEKYLPSENKINRIINQDRRYAEYFFSVSKNIKSLVNYHDFMPKMAKLIGCKPRILHLNNPLLSFKMYFGSHLSVFYRLNDKNQQIRQEALNIIKSLPIAYSFRRAIIIIGITILFRPIEYIYLLIKKV